MAISLSWTTRLKICLGAARGLEYLHSSLGGRKRVIHRDFKSANILLDENMEARICDFTFSTVIDPTQPAVLEHATGTLSYLDPVYLEKGIVNTELDVYSFGVILFDMLNGMLAYNGKRIHASHPQTLISLVRNSYDDRLYNFIPPYERRNFDIRSFNVFKEIAYKCISLKLEDRPTMSEIVKRFEEALAIENHRAASTISTRSEQYLKREGFLIPVEDITLPIGYLGHPLFISPHCHFSKLHASHKGQLSERWQNRTAIFKRFGSAGFRESNNEVDMFLRFNNENIISFIGYCKHFSDCILVLEYAINGSLYDHLYDPDKRRCLTWEKRLKICIGAAGGLKYLHSGLGEHTRVIHANVKSKMILLDDKLEAKISGFQLSELVEKDQPQVYESITFTDVYKDPLYNGIMKTESDIYSFRVVLFEMLSGMLAIEEKMISDAPSQSLMNLVRQYHDGGQESLIDPLIKDEINTDSLQAFIKVAYRCISLNVQDRPTMSRIISRIEEALDIQNQGVAARSQGLDLYQIPLMQIELATNGFSPETLRGDGGFGKVYKGQLSDRWQNRIVAVKRLHQERALQGKEEFHNELKLISSFHHKNIIPYVGYCDEGDQMILVTEYASNHSLDYHLQNRNKRSCLTWAQRLKICLGAAKGLNYLHSGQGKEEGVIHRDVKSANILLDINMEAKICDFGLSKQNPENQQGTHIYTNAAGTNYYLDPIYQEGGILHKSSDVYSFGVVLFEILSGILAYKKTSIGDGKPHPLINLVRHYYNNGLEKLIDPLITEKIDNRCFQTYKEVAYKCISHTPAERPTMETIIERIEDAMEFQGLKV